MYLETGDSIPKPKVTEEDIICYKIVKKLPRINPKKELKESEYVYSPLYFLYAYKLYPQINKSDISVNISCNDLNDAVRYTIAQGFHSFKYYKDALKYFDMVKGEYCIITKCIIPKGALYYSGVLVGYDYENYVSSELIIEGEIENC